MIDHRICYSGGYKYQIRNDYVFRLPQYFPQDVIYEGEFLSVSEGYCTIHKGYASDGPSGPLAPPQMDILWTEVCGSSSSKTTKH